MTTTLTATGRKLLDTLPYPIASAWGRVIRARNPSEQVRQCWALLDIYLRYTSGVLLAGYLRGEPVEAVEDIIPKMERPSNGHYCALIREILRSFRDQEDHFFSHAVEWYFNKRGKPTEEAKILDALITERNKDAHGSVRTDSELGTVGESLLFRFQTLLHRSKWLSGYRIFRVSQMRNIRKGGQKGKIHFYQGESEKRHPIQGCWSCTLYDDAMYLSTPEGNSFLEVTPFLSMENDGRLEKVFLWVSTPKGKRIELRCDESSSKTETLPLLDEVEVSWQEWLERREELEDFLLNQRPEDFHDEDFHEIGQLLGGRYQIEEKLGEGGMAVVYTVQDTIMDEKVALKVLQLGQVDSKAQKRIKSEFKLMKELKHSHILAMKAIDVLSDGRITLSMPLMQGTLKDLQEAKQITQSKIEKWTIQILSALDYLHHRTPPIFHRDIKPSNLLYDENEDVFLADFGIARQQGDIRLTRTKEQLGSLPYMAPELLEGLDAGAETDRYGLAVTLHELITSKLTKTPGKEIKGEFGEFIRHLAAKEPKERLRAIWPPAIAPKPDRRLSISPKIRNLREGPAFQNFRIQWQSTQGNRKADIVAKPTALFGRDANLSDVQLLVEPVYPLERYPENVRKSMRISGQHFQISIQNGQASATDLGSQNGTMVYGIPMLRDIPYPLKTSLRLEVAGVLDLKLEPIQSKEGVTAIVVHRLRNVPQNSYLVLSTEVGIWPDRISLFGPSTDGGSDSPLRICYIDEEPCLLNNTVEDLTLDGDKIKKNEAVPLKGHGSFLLSAGNKLIKIENH